MFFYARYAYCKNEYIGVDTPNNMLYNKTRKYCKYIDITIFNGGLKLCQDLAEAETAVDLAAARASEEARAADLAVVIAVAVITVAITVVIIIDTDTDFTDRDLECSASVRDGTDLITADITVAAVVLAGFSESLCCRLS